MPEDLLEAVDETTEPVDAVDATAETTEPTEGEQQQTEETERPITSLFQPDDASKLDPKVMRTLAEIRAKSPDVASLLSKAAHRVAQFEREFPGGFAEIKELRDQIESLGGTENIESAFEDSKQFGDLVQQFQSGDQAFVNDMAETDPAAFAAIAPKVFDKFAEVNSDAFAGYIGRIVFRDMQSQSVPLMMMRLADTIADNPKAKEAFQAINDYLGGFKVLSEKPLPEGKKGAAPAKDDAGKKEQDLRSREWQMDRTALEKQIVNSEYQKLLAGRKPTSEERAQILELLGAKRQSLADSLFPGWKEKADRYLSNGNKDGYMRYIGSIYRRVLPEAVAYAVRRTLKAAPKPAAAAQARPQLRTAAAGASASPDFKPVAKEPGSYEIDYSKTTPKMLAQNRAVLLSGGKVSWR